MTDKTIAAVSRQLAAMNCEKFRIGVYNEGESKMIIRDGIREQGVMNLVPWLKFENRNGNNIFVSPSPAENRALILVDDLSLAKIEEMDRRGVNPACVLETSESNYQVWVSIGKELMSETQRTIMSRLLAKEFGGDCGSVGKNHFGRLAGFTNRKEEHKGEVWHPFVLCHRWSGEQALKTDAIRDWLTRQENELLEQERKIRDEIADKGDVCMLPQERTMTREATYTKYYKEWKTRRRESWKPEDVSVGDYAVACRMLKEGYLTKEVEAAMLSCSAAIAIRKAGHIEDYVVRTVRAAAKKCQIIIR
jgi:hypothetical protein